MNRLFGFWLPCIAGLSIAILAVAPPANAYDLAAATASFAADKAKLAAGSPVMRGWSGSDSSVATYSIERIMDAAAWDAVWARHAPGTTAPDVDFKTAMVVAIFAGDVRTSVIPEIHLASVTEADTVDVTAMNYENDVISEERKNLYVIIVLRRSTKPVRVFARTFALMRNPEEETSLLKEFGAVVPPR